jgi:hypothetical protein
MNINDLKPHPVFIWAINVGIARIKARIKKEGGYSLFPKLQEKIQFRARIEKEFAVSKYYTKQHTRS